MPEDVETHLELFVVLVRFLEFVHEFLEKGEHVIIRELGVLRSRGRDVNCWRIRSGHVRGTRRRDYRKRGQTKGRRV